MPLFTPEERKRTAQNVSDMLESDERIDAVLIVGSLASKTADRWPDIDLLAAIGLPLHLSGSPRPGLHGTMCFMPARR
ncbi:MAG: aminoglycoside 6-adenylyltransferase [Actinomycetota bacterium]|nr:aminoglycoside 6-adenylyltransferase [Actinomycetota bacterium]